MGYRHICKKRIDFKAIKSTRKYQKKLQSVFTFKANHRLLKHCKKHVRLFYIDPSLLWFQNDFHKTNGTILIHVDASYVRASWKIDIVKRVLSLNKSG